MWPKTEKGLQINIFIMHANKYLLWNFRNGLSENFSSGSPEAPRQPAKCWVPTISLRGNRSDPEGAKVFLEQKKAMSLPPHLSFFSSETDMYMLKLSKSRFTSSWGENVHQICGVIGESLAESRKFRDDPLERKQLSKLNDSCSLEYCLFN